MVTDIKQSLLLIALGAVGIANAQIYVYQEATAGGGDFVLEGQAEAFTASVDVDTHCGWVTNDTSSATTTTLVADQD